VARQVDLGPWGGEDDDDDDHDGATPEESPGGTPLLTPYGGEQENGHHDHREMMGPDSAVPAPLGDGAGVGPMAMVGGGEPMTSDIISI
jgi:hypothetical protein